MKTRIYAAPAVKGLKGYIAQASNCVAKCYATPDKLFPANNYKNM